MIDGRAVYRHYMGGLYRVLFTALETTNGADKGRERVVYVSLSTGAICVRDALEFDGFVDTDVGPVRRFEKVA